MPCAVAGSSREGYEVRRALVPAASAKATKEQAEDDQEDPPNDVSKDQKDDPDDHEDCAYAHYVSPLSLEVAPQGLLALDRLE